MKKTVRINMSGIALNIDEDAYLQLNNYLKAIANRFSHTDDGDEIILDIEARIAELFQERLTATKQAITLSDVNEVINTLGSPEMFGDTETDEIPMADKQTGSTKHNRKKFFRDGENRILGGVCSGLGNYFNIDPIVFRIALLVLASVYGSGTIIYFILWMIIPEAKTSAQKLEMLGQDINLENIEKIFRHEFQNVKQRFTKFTGSQEYSNGLNKLQNGLERVLVITAEIFKGIAKSLAIIIGILLVVSGISIFIAVTGTIFFSDDIIALTPWQNHSFSIYELLNFFVNPQSIVLILIGLFLLLIIPVASIIFAGIRLIIPFKANTKLIGLLATFGWIIGLVIIMFLGIKEAKRFKNNSFIESSFVLNNKIDTLKIGSFAQATLPDGMIDFDDFQIGKIDGSETIFQRIKLDIEPSTSDSLLLLIRQSASGYNEEDAKANAKEVGTFWKGEQSNLNITPYFYLNKNKKWSVQQVEYILKVPVGKVVYINGDIVQTLDDVANVENMWDGDMGDKRWLMTKDGLSLLDKPVGDSDVSFENEPITADGSSNGLIDGQKAELDLESPFWLKIEENDLVATVNLGEIKTISSLRISFFNNWISGVFAPEEVIFSYSVDGNEYSDLQSVELGFGIDSVYIYDYNIDGIAFDAQYIKVTAPNRRVVPDNHPDKGKAAWLYFDELTITPKSSEFDDEVNELKKELKKELINAK